jgi:hypothetical protein
MVDIGSDRDVQVNRSASLQAVAAQRPDAWTDAELAVIADPTLTIRQIQQRLPDRTPGAITDQRRDSNLGRAPVWTLEEIGIMQSGLTDQVAAVRIRKLGWHRKCHGRTVALWRRGKR